ncbi:hypothetical protein QNO21_08460 [Microbacterium sp. zg-Y818]|uniref:hypothetical protein n=1 Tax=unclassified Microbacterium TaxID=2609290 RepID=UPI00214BDAA6|nr:MULTISPECIES: hypothetical protein [unclassified Microbacterium]MCR2801336.1 hypothetical protein [Microbacterium sp. zg.Y818]WIM21165.1 hypothetical protein QNO21_08460 [Microbacterium sp. zg-Y818]
MPSSPHDASSPATPIAQPIADPPPPASRRIEIMFRRPAFALYARIRPALVIGGRGQPTQWGVGTWQVPADETAVIGVYLFNRLWRFGQAEFALAPGDAPSLVYRAPVLPFGRGRIERG